MNKMDKASQNKLLRMSFNSLKLPRISSASSSQSRPTLSEDSIIDDHLIPGRRSFMLNPYGIPSPTPLKLPKLTISPRVDSVKTASEESGGRKQRVTTLPPLKLTKHEQLQQEIASTNLTCQRVDRLNMDFDRKLSSVHQSMQKFQQKCSSVKNTMDDAIRRSVADAARNKAVNSSGRPVSDRRDSYEEKCTKVRKTRIRPRPADLATGLEQITSTARESSETTTMVNDNLTQNQSNDHFPQVPVRVTSRIQKNAAQTTGESCITTAEAEFDDHFTSLSIQGEQQQLEPEILYEDNHDDDRQSLQPIMENLSDKAFLTKLKIKDSQANRTMQKMQSRTNAMQNQLQLDKLKAKLESKSEKPLYKPRKEHLNTTESRQELMGFLQSHGGTTGNWNSSDHVKFLKIYNAWRGVPEMIIEKSIEEFRHKTATEVMAHAEWYERFEELIESNKNEVRKWDEGRRKEREMIYQMEAEDRKTKLEDEKRRVEHLKSVRIQERENSRLAASKWKNLKNKSDAINADPVEIDTTGITEEMLDLAKRIQALEHPFPNTRKSIPHHLRHVSAKTFSNIQKSTSELSAVGAQKKKASSKSAPVKPQRGLVERIKLPSLDVNENSERYDEDDTESICTQNQSRHDFSELLEQGDFDHSKITESLSTRKPVSQLKSETFTHKIRKEAQIIKRMEIRSLQRKVPHRVEEIQLQSVTNSLCPKRGTPNWRKIS